MTMASSTVRVKVEGLKELEKALQELPKSTGKNVLRRILRARAQPLADGMKAIAPDDPATGGNDLKASITASTQLSKRQRSLHRKEFKDDKAAAEIFVGPGPLPYAHMLEFGGANNSPQPYVRPIWDAEKDGLLTDFGNDLWKEISAASRRLAKKNARLAAKG